MKTLGTVLLVVILATSVALASTSPTFPNLKVWATTDGKIIAHSPVKLYVWVFAGEELIMPNRHNINNLLVPGEPRVIFQLSSQEIETIKIAFSQNNGAIKTFFPLQGKETIEYNEAVNWLYLSSQETHYVTERMWTLYRDGKTVLVPQSVMIEIILHL